MGEKKTPNPFIVACDKFIYLEILQASVSKENGKSKEVSSVQLDKINPKLIRLISSTISDLAEDDGWAFMGDVGNLLQKKQPNFDSRNYGFQKLTPLVSAIPNFEVERREKLIYVRNRE
jgi:hypothetical protein